MGATNGVAPMGATNGVAPEGLRYEWVGPMMGTNGGVPMGLQQAETLAGKRLTKWGMGCFFLLLDFQ